MRFTFWDGLTNLVTGMGVSGRDKSAAGQFTESPVGIAELHAMFRDDFLCKKIISIPAYDMCREGRQWKAEGEFITDLENAEKALQVWPKLRKAKTWARLYGGAALILDDGTRSYEREISPDRFEKDQLKQIHAVSNFRLTLPEGLEGDIRSPFFGQPKVYELSVKGGSPIRIHPSRVIPIHGELAPDTDTDLDWWGDSVLRSVYSAVRNAARTQHGFAQLAEEAKVDIVAIGNLKAQVQDSASREALLERWGVAQLNKSMNGVLIVDRDDEEYVTRELSFANHDKIIEKFLVIVSGAADIPATRMLGQSPAGLNSTGESDLRNYYDGIGGRQETEIRPALDRLDAFLVPHALGNAPEELWYEFRPLWKPSAKEQADIHKTNAETAQIYINSGAIDPVAVKEGVESLLVETGFMPGFERGLEMAKSAAEEGEAILPAEPPDDPDEDDDEAQRIPSEDARPRTLYVSRRVRNAAAIAAWAKAQGFRNVVSASELHVTVAYSRAPIDWMSIHADFWQELEIEGGARLVEPLGDEGAIVLFFKAHQLEARWHDFIDAGASWDFEEYQPHITITYDKGDVDLDNVEPYLGPIMLGPERFEEIEDSFEKQFLTKEGSER